MVIIQGYKIEGQDINQVEQLLLEMQQVVKNRANESYHKLLSREIEILFDNIALNVLPRPTNVSILDAAKNQLNQRIAYATATQNPTEYNFYVSVNVMFHEDATYIKFNANNNIYKKQLSKIKGLTPYYLEEKGTEVADPEREELWRFLMEKYSTGVAPLSIQMMPLGEFAINTKMLSFKTPNQRAKIIARHNLTNKYLRIYACEGEIPNYRLMELMDEALTAISDSSWGAEELKFMEEDLRRKNLLPNITIALISQDPTDTATEKNFAEAETGCEDPESESLPRP